MDGNREVGIIGAGIHGASAAFHLAARWGIRATVFEQVAPAGGPTGRSSAICRAYYTNQYLARIAHASLAMFRTFGELTNGGDCGFRQTGIVYLHPDTDAAALRDAANSAARGESKSLDAYLDRYCREPATLGDYLERVGIKRLLALHEY